MHANLTIHIKQKEILSPCLFTVNLLYKLEVTLLHKTEAYQIPAKITSQNRRHFNFLHFDRHERIFGPYFNRGHIHTISL